MFLTLNILNISLCAVSIAVVPWKYTLDWAEFSKKLLSLIGRKELGLLPDPNYGSYMATTEIKFR